MNRLLVTLVFAFGFLYAGLAHAVPRYLVEDSSNVIKAYTEDDSLVAPPGHTAVNVSVIEAVYSGTIYQGGTWVVTGGVGVYTPPTGIVVPIDTATDQGAVQQAAVNMMAVFDEAVSYIHANRHAWTHEGVKRATDGIHWMMVNAARVALNSTRTHANRQKFLEEAASWPLLVNGNVTDYTDAMEESSDSITGGHLERLELGRS